MSEKEPQHFYIKSHLNPNPESQTTLVFAQQKILDKTPKGQKANQNANIESQPKEEKINIKPVLLLQPGVNTVGSRKLTEVMSADLTSKENTPGSNSKKVKVTCGNTNSMLCLKLF